MQNTVLETLALLEQRLARLQFYLGHGDGDLSLDEKSSESRDAEPVEVRLSKLEAKFTNICSHSVATQELLNLHARHPDLMREDEKEASSTSAQKQQVLLSSASVYSNAHSGLNALQQSSVPDGETIADLIALKPRIQQAQVVQHNQLQQLLELRDRSATLLLQWYQRGVLSNGEQWAEIEARLSKMEQTIRRRETTAAKEQNEI